MTIQYLTNEKGECTAVQIAVEDWKKIQEELEMMEDVRLYDEAKADNLTFRPLNEALKDIEEQRAKQKN